jgi:hypothetical protein
MKVISFINEPPIIWQILAHLGLWSNKPKTRPPVRAGPRANQWELQPLGRCHSQSKSRLMMAGPALKNPISATIDPPFAVHALFCSMCNSCCCDIRCCCFSVKRLQRKVSRTAVIRLLTGNFLICNVNYSNYEGVGSGGCFSWVLCRLVRGKLARLC